MEQLKSVTESIKLPESLNNIGDKLNVSNITGNASQTVNNMSQQANSITESIKQNLDGFSSQSVVNAGSEFLTSNSIIAKIVFLILVVVAFVILVSIGVGLITYFSQAAKNTEIPKNKANAIFFIFFEI
jgi:hypothetical protein